MVWEKLGSTTLDSTGDKIDISEFTAKKFYQAMSFELGSGNITVQFTFNNSTGADYSARWSNNGGSDNVYADQSDFGGYLSSSTDYDTFNMINAVSISGQEKLIIMSTVDSGGAGAGNAPNRAELVAKFVPDPDANIIQLEVDNTGSGDYASDSNASILGTN